MWLKLLGLFCFILLYYLKCLFFLRPSPQKPRKDERKREDVLQKRGINSQCVPILSLESQPQ